MEGLRWTAAARERFMGELAATADVTAAALAAGTTAAAAHRRRARDAGFAAAWTAALAEAASRLEALLLRRAIEAVGEAPRTDGPKITVREALAVVAHHQARLRDAAKGDGAAEETGEAMRARILASLEQMEARLAANDGRG